MAKPSLDLLSRQVRISISVEETRFGREQRARAVHLDRAAFQNHPRVKNRKSEKFRYARRQSIIKREGRIFVSPRVVIPVDHGEFWIANARGKRRGHIADTDTPPRP